MEKKESLNFFKQVSISIKDFDKYDIFALRNVKESIKYLFTIVLIFSFIATLIYSYKIYTGGLEEIITEVQSTLDEKIEINVNEMEDIIKQNYGVFAVIIYLSILSAYFCSCFIDAVMLAILGILVARIVGMKMQFKSTLNIGIHALTLPLILQILYLFVNVLFAFEIKYFEWAYTTISYIYVIVAILMIKTEFINQQRELIRIQNEQEKIREELKNQEQEDKDTNEENKEDKKKKEKEEKEDTNIGETPEGTNA